MSTSLKMIPLCQLHASKINVRKTGADTDIGILAASIEAHGLLENLIVSKSPATNPPSYKVIAGGRRLAALKLLARRKTIARDQPVPCQVRNGASNLVELSLAENFARAPLHPADQYEAFAALKEAGLPADDIAARFGLSTTLVLQRLKLAAVSPRLLAEYRKDALTLEQLMAFTICDDHKAQEEVWFGNPYRDVAPHTIRRLLTSTHVDSHDHRARFIGAKAYEAAGGTIVRDLFDTETDGYFTDSQLLDRLVAERLEANAASVRAEGWAWVEIWAQTDYDRMNRYGRAQPVEAPLPRKDQKRLAKLGTRYDTLVAELEDEGEQDDRVRELDAVTAELETLQARTVLWPDVEKARSGAVIQLDHDGSPHIVRGLIRPEDTPRPTRPKPDNSPEEARAYSEALLTDLSAHRTAALRELLASQPDKALTALLSVLVRSVFFDAYGSGCLRIAVSVTELERHSKSVSGSKAACSSSARLLSWRQAMPNEDALWPWLETLGAEERMRLLAVCVAAGLDGVWRRQGEVDVSRTADVLAQALALDMADWWCPTEGTYLGQVTKAQIVAAVGDAVSPAEARRLVGCSKAEMCQKAEALLANTRWLPEPLRIAPPDVTMQSSEGP
jgi:ParB family chromosome partitioning protein